MSVNEATALDQPSLDTWMWLTVLTALGLVVAWQMVPKTLPDAAAAVRLESLPAGNYVASAEAPE